MKTYKLELSNSPQLIPLENEGCSIAAESENGKPFEGIIASQGDLDDLDENKSLHFKSAKSGVFKADFTEVKTPETWYLILKADEPTTVTVNVSPVQAAALRSLSAPVAAQRKKFKVSWPLAILVMIAIGVALFFLLNGQRPLVAVPAQQPVPPNDDFMDQLNSLPDI
jgi:hypothetical protein